MFAYAVFNSLLLYVMVLVWVILMCVFCRQHCGCWHGKSLIVRVPKHDINEKCWCLASQ